MLTVSGGSSVGTTTALNAAVSPITYGQSASITATVTPASGTTAPTGSVTLTIDGTTTMSATLSGGMAGFTVTGLGAGSHVFSATYTGASAFAPSTTSPSGKPLADCESGASHGHRLLQQPASTARSTRAARGR